MAAQSSRVLIFGFERSRSQFNTKTRSFVIQLHRLPNWCHCPFVRHAGMAASTRSKKSIRWRILHPMENTTEAPYEPSRKQSDWARKTAFLETGPPESRVGEKPHCQVGPELVNATAFGRSRWRGGR